VTYMRYFTKNYKRRQQGTSAKRLSTARSARAYNNFIEVSLANMLNCFLYHFGRFAKIPKPNCLLLSWLSLYIKVMLLAAEVMLLAAEVMLLHAEAMPLSRY